MGGIFFVMGCIVPFFEDPCFNVYVKGRFMCYRVRRCVCGFIDMVLMGHFWFLNIFLNFAMPIRVVKGFITLYYDLTRDSKYR